jgi:hypothetical protein
MLLNPLSSHIRSNACYTPCQTQAWVTQVISIRSSLLLLLQAVLYYPGHHKHQANVNRYGCSSVLSGLLHLNQPRNGCQAERNTACACQTTSSSNAITTCKPQSSAALQHRMPRPPHCCCGTLLNPAPRGVCGVNHLAALVPEVYIRCYCALMHACRHSTHSQLYRQVTDQGSQSPKAAMVWQGHGA